MLQLVLVAAGGAIGALSRYAADRIALVAFGSAVPGTLFVNASGSFILGLFTGYLVQNPEVPAHWKLFFAVGLLGSYTTFSTFSVATLNLLNAGDIPRAIANILLNVGLGLLLAAIGFVLGKLL